MIKLTRRASVAVLVALSATAIPQVASATMATTDDYVAANEHDNFFVDINPLALFRTSNASSPFWIQQGTSIDFINGADLDFAPAFGIQAAIGGTFGDSNVGVLLRGFYAAPTVGTYRATVADITGCYVVEALGCLPIVGDFDILAVETSHLSGMDGNLLFRIAPGMSVYAGIASFQLDDMFEFFEEGGELHVTWTAANSMVGGQLGTRFNIGVEQSDRLSAVVDLRGGFLRNTVSRVGVFNVQDSIENAFAWFLASDIEARVQLSPAVAVAFGYHPLLLSGVALAHEQPATLIPYPSPPPSWQYGSLSLATVLIHGVSLGLHLQF